MNLREFKNCILGLVVLGGFFFVCHFAFYLAKTGEKAVDIWLVKTNPDNPGYKVYWEKEWAKEYQKTHDETGKARK